MNWFFENIYIHFMNAEVDPKPLISSKFPIMFCVIFLMQLTSF